jgi:hypothetical protein
MNSEKRDEELERLFAYHPPKEDQRRRYQHIQEAAKFLGYVIKEHCPESRERDVAIQLLTMVRMTANQSIAVNE